MNKKAKMNKLIKILLWTVFLAMALAMAVKFAGIF
tara:strand:+ start:113 stop:217 length:105 start_codon:yes stop_codon:yes gene_type:complete